MCRNPITISNPAYHEGEIRGMPMDSVTYSIKPYLVVPCGKCDQCKQQQCNDWTFRIRGELERPLSPNCRNIFITLTISDEYYNKDVHPRVYLRRFFERVRQRTGRSIKHWMCFEYGSNPYCSHRLHFHGILFNCDRSNAWLRKLWAYGRIFIGSYCNERTASYITKYIMKSARLHNNLPSYWKFPPVVMCSAGIGSYLVETSAELLRRIARRCGKMVCNNFSYRIPSYYLKKVLTRGDLIVRRLASIALAPDENTFRGRRYADAREVDFARAEYNRLTQQWQVKPRIRYYVPNISPNPEFAFTP